MSATTMAASSSPTTIQRELAFLGIASSPAFVREPEGNGCAERFIRTLKENLLWVRRFDTIEELRLALHAFKDSYNRTWIVERHGYQTPAAVRAAQLRRSRWRHESAMRCLITVDRYTNDHSPERNHDQPGGRSGHRHRIDGGRDHERPLIGCGRCRVGADYPFASQGREERSSGTLAVSRRSRAAASLSRCQRRTTAEYSQNGTMPMMSIIANSAGDANGAGNEKKYRSALIFLGRSLFAEA